MLLDVCPNYISLCYSSTSQASSTSRSTSSNDDDDDAAKKREVAVANALAQRRRMEDEQLQVQRRKEDAALELRRVRTLDPMKKLIVEQERDAVNAARNIQDEKRENDRRIEDLRRESGSQFSRREGVDYEKEIKFIQNQNGQLAEELSNRLEIINGNYQRERELARRNREQAQIEDKRRVQDMIREEDSQRQDLQLQTQMTLAPNEYARENVSFDIQKADARQGIEGQRAQILRQKEDLLRQQRYEQIDQIESGIDYGSKIASLDRQLSILQQQYENQLQRIRIEQEKYYKQTANEMVAQSSDVRKRAGSLREQFVDLTPAEQFQKKLRDIGDAYAKQQDSLKENIQNLLDLRGAMQAAGIAGEELVKINQEINASNKAITLSEKEKQDVLAWTGASERNRRFIAARQTEFEVVGTKLQIDSNRASVMEQSGDIFGARSLQKEVARGDAGLRYDQQMLALKEQQKQEPDNPYISQQMLTLGQLYNQELALINAQYDEMQLLAQPLQSAFQGLFSSLLTDITSLGDAFTSFFSAIAQSMADLFATIAAQKVISAIFPSLFPVNAGVAQNLAFGGEVGVGTFRPIIQALKREGDNAVLAALTPGVFC